MLNAAARLMLVLQFIIRSMLSVMDWLGTALAELHKIHKISHHIRWHTHSCEASLCGCGCGSGIDRQADRQRYAKR